MPTENRSTNTEMISVPRERALQLISLLAGVASAAHWLVDNSEDCGDEGIDCQRVDFEALSDALEKCEELPELPDSMYVRDGWLRAADELRALLAQPAEQHQGEPVVLPARKHGIHADYSQNPLADGWNACLDEIAKLGPLYTHADPGEVEQLTAEIAELLAERNDLRAELEEELGGWKERCRKLNDESMAWMRKHDTLRAQLADLKRRHDGLHRDMATIAGREVPKGCTVADYAAAAIADALSASAEPSAPVERDERAEFETEFKRIGRPLTRADYHPEAYGNAFDDGAWTGWQARAALERKPSVAPDDDQPCDLATWKRRAIEAESKLRTYDPQIVEMGERAMKMLLADPKPDEVVLMKCKLCDQLQADITARDEELDRVCTVVATARQKACLPREIESLLDSALDSRKP